MDASAVRLATRAAPGLARACETRDNRTMRAMLFVSTLPVGALAAREASADVFKLSAEVDTGGQAGTGVSGAQKDSSFFGKSPPLLYGAAVTGELFGLLDATIQHHQFTDGDRLTTW